MKQHFANKTSLKTLGPQSSALLVALHEKRRSVFTLHDVETLAGLDPKPARDFVAALVRRGVAARLKPGLFTLVPFELGREREYIGNPYVVARELMRGRNYYVSHASAMDIHGMITQPQLVVYVTSPHPTRSRSILGTEFHFVRCKPEHLFGVVDEWVDKTERVSFSSRERTVVDGLRQPGYCGGITDVARGFWIRRNDIDVSLLVEHAVRLGVGAVFRRLGFLLEVYEIDAPSEIALLQSRLTSTYELLDPTLPAEGKRSARWRLQLNISSEELLASRST